MATSWFFVAIVPLVLCLQPKIVMVPQFGRVSQVMDFTLNSNIKYLLLYHPQNNNNPYSIKAWSDSASPQNPILIVVNQGIDTLSWSVPYSIFSQSEVYYHTSRTLCDSHNQNFTITLSTSAPTNTKLSMIVEEERFFHLVNGKRHTIEISPSEPRYFSYDYVPQSHSSLVTIEIDSDDETCLMVSVQKHTCPVLDLNNFINYQGFHQTILTKGGMRIRKKYYTGGFFLVFTVVEDEVCKKKDLPIIPNQNQSSTVHFTVTENIESKNHYIPAVFIVLACFILFSFVAIAIFCVFERYRKKKIAKNTEQIAMNVDEKTEEEIHEERDENNQQIPNNVADFSQNTQKNQKRSMNYLWQILNVGLFYIIPVIQLVVTLQSFLIQTGDFDLCYYNFRCANPLWIISDFNHVFSNIGYILMGIVFSINVFYRHFYSPPLTTGVPANYGVFYAMGAALIMEGVLSGCYHLCPNETNFQFDTSFMYVMIVLCLVKLYQNRHPDVTPTAYTTFSILGATILCGTIGIVFKAPPVFIVFVTIAYLVLLIYASLNIYHFGTARNFLRRCCLRNSEVPRPIQSPNTHRWWLLLLAITVNILLYGLGLILFYHTKTIDFATFILQILAGNAFLYTVVYTCMKIKCTSVRECTCSEKICAQAIIYGFLALVTWVLAGVFFFTEASKWTESPAQSRQLNKQCIFADFYDSRDLWHFFSSLALYFTFMYLLCIDDNLYTNRADIPLF
ncbi:Sid-1-related B precursor [Tribolium castaneum]|uniref:Sid-1-related B n=1 Tax=Tribolium castaneum TaxID=7070 RepID=A7YFW0_TRICA|nr:Sid-1-related B precursor [Tribolium castaneum]ABU63673.1 Sid-1-related B [Tribolium castaneum]|eukprot:NP_001103253.1 Sid-1-related B precursor [Tribolium castaneum]